MPWIEYNMRKVDIEQIPSPRLLTTHLPHYLVPKGLKNKKTKIIYVTRNPKDNMVSYYHFGNMMRESIEEPTVMLEEHFEKYCTGKVVGGSWFDHVKGWHTHKGDFNILFLHYEDMMKDLRGAILKICRFVGKDLDDQTVDAIVERATFKNMKNDPLANYENVGPHATKPPKKINFLRKEASAPETHASCYCPAGFSLSFVQLHDTIHLDFELKGSLPPLDLSTSLFVISHVIKRHRLPYCQTIM
ncbi:amine sulfotransferase-like [Lissotriton helveticus]